MNRTNFAIALEIDRTLSLSLSNKEFELMAAFVADSEDPEQTAINVINCGQKIAWYILETLKTY